MDILFEDANLVVLKKPQNCPTQKDKTHQKSLIEMLEDHYAFKMGIDDQFIGIVHRLDRHTGGVIVFAKTEEALKTLNHLFATHKITKYYLAIVEGHVQKSSESLTNYLSVDTSTNLVRIVRPSFTQAKKAELKYRCIEKLDIELGPLSLLKITLLTGRQHQIRIQMSAIGHPVLGDIKYGSKLSTNPSLSMALWSNYLSFHAFGKKYEFAVEPDQSQYWSYFDKKGL